MYSFKKDNFNEYELPKNPSYIIFVAIIAAVVPFAIPIALTLGVPALGILAWKNRKKK